MFTVDSSVDSPEEPYQEVYFDNSGLSEVTGNAGEQFTLPLKYKSSDGSSTTGLKLEIYYDSTLITPVSVEDQLPAIINFSKYFWIIYQMNLMQILMRVQINI